MEILNCIENKFSKKQQTGKEQTEHWQLCKWPSVWPSLT